MSKWVCRWFSLSSKHYGAIGAGSPCPGAPSGADALMMETKAATTPSVGRFALWCSEMLQIPCSETFIFKHFAKRKENGDDSVEVSGRGTVTFLSERSYVTVNSKLNYWLLQGVYIHKVRTLLNVPLYEFHQMLIQIISHPTVVDIHFTKGYSRNYGPCTTHNYI